MVMVSALDKVGRVAAGVLDRKVEFDGLLPVAEFRTFILVEQFFSKADPT